MHKETNYLPDNIANKRTKITLLTNVISFSLGLVGFILGCLTGELFLAITAFVLVTIISYGISLLVLLSIMVPFKYWHTFMCSDDTSIEIFRQNKIGGDVNDPSSLVYRSNRESNSTKG